ncbi:amino acid adenylation domain-containing protein [Amycolatopsis sp. DG1A-15b]|uniref:amino acid adenylation domain-containing protein n=1 Tax=Amycolatopsis sp. DG1A-15b TaxID=3052846 RepID=UPI00255BBF96|nr:amino acid adenylation domain-containing protein [Amycolatopsis sp. DG1A-15b]WIX93020.1 amino acid adenylation domain-containing protein [Amycolatopsis sp. DG1A-15b]
MSVDTPTRTGSRPAHRWVEQRAAETPDAVAVLADTDLTAVSLTYRELDESANRIAHWLRSRGVGAEDRVGVHLDRGLDLVAVLLGIFKAGAVYVPLDPHLPAARLAHVLADSAPAVTFTSADLPDLPSEGALPVETVRAEWASFPATRPEVPYRGATAAYVVYTSGSTGTPKGVVVPYEALATQLGWLCTRFRFGPADVVLHKTPLASDPSLWELLVPVMSGGRLVLAEPLNHGDPAYLLDVHDHYGVTACDFFPSLLRHFLAEPRAAERAAALRTVICGGEELNAELATRFAEVLPGATLYNLYGPTEATIAVTLHQVAAAGVTDPIPIGRPIPGTEILVLDHAGAPCPAGVTGELVIAGVQLARGYQGRPAQTAERFVPHPGRAGERLYRTGDRARWRPDGALEFLGRLDHQVKIRGHRVEPAEVEAALTARPEVAQAVVLARAAPGGGPRLVAYLTRSAAGPELPTAALRRALAGQLPAAMIPAVFVWLDAFPLTAVGKIDRAALPDPAG